MNKFDLYLVCPEEPKKASAVRKIDPEKEFVLWEIARLIDLSGAKFILEGFDGFGKTHLSDWDLAMAMEAMPEVIKKLCENDFDFDVYFYEQGSEFKLIFDDYSEELVGVAYKEVDVCDITGETPVFKIGESKRITAKKEDVKQIFFKICQDFFFLAENVCGELLEIPCEQMSEISSIKEMIK